MKKVAGAIATIAGFGLWLLSIGIYLFTLYVAYLTSFPALLGALVFPFLAQLYWIWALWSVTGTFFHLLTVLCLAWLALLGAAVGLGAYSES